MGSLMEYRRRILLNTPHLETVSGSVAHFTTDMSAKLKELKVSFLPQQAGSGDPSPSNVRAISGWTGCDVWKSGKNLFDENACRFGYWTNSSGVVSENNKGVLSANIPINPNQAVSLSFYGVSPYSYSIIELDENLGFLFRTHKSIQDHSIVSPGTLTLTTGASTRYIYIQTYDNANTTITQEILASFKLQLELGSQSTAYEPFQSNKITVSWQDLGTIYGGFIDVLRGELVQTHNFTHITTMSYTNSGNANRAYSDVLSGVKTYGSTVEYIHNIVSDKIAPEEVGTSYPDPYVGFISKNGRFTIGLPEEITTRELFNEWLEEIGGIDLVYELETPITYPLSPEIIKAIKGVNNVWSDANGDVEVKFWTH